MNNRGHITLSREYRDKYPYPDMEKFGWLVDLLMEKNYKEDSVLIEKRFYKCGKDQLIISEPKLAKRYNVSRSNITRFLDRLQAEGIISKENLIRCTRMTFLEPNFHEKLMNRLERSQSGVCSDLRTEGEQTSSKKANKTFSNKSESYEDSRTDLERKSEHNRNKEDNLLKEKKRNLSHLTEPARTPQSVKGEVQGNDLNLEFEEFLKSAEAENLQKDTPYDPIH